MKNRGRAAGSASVLFFLCFQLTKVMTQVNLVLQTRLDDFKGGIFYGIWYCSNFHRVHSSGHLPYLRHHRRCYCIEGEAQTAPSKHKKRLISAFSQSDGTAAES